MGKSIIKHRKLCVRAQFSVHLTEKCLKQKSVKILGECLFITHTPQSPKAKKPRSDAIGIMVFSSLTQYRIFRQSLFLSSGDPPKK